MKKTFDSCLEIDLSKVKHNFEVIKSYLSKESVCAAVVKANAYGVGMKQVSQALSTQGCNDFFVAYLNEAIDLKGILPGANIYMFHGIKSDTVEISARSGFVPVLNDLGQIELWNKESSRLGKKLPAILHFDTGMSRLGLSPSQVHMLQDHPELIENIDVKYMMSHFACADDPEHELNAIQLDKMHQYSKAFPQFKTSYANSAALLLGKQYQGELVRPGCALYGINPTNAKKNPFAQVVTLKARVLQIQTFEQELPISYGATQTLPKGSRVATLACGYADGYHRDLSNTGVAYFERYRLPIVGRVTMDMVMVDVSEVPENLLSQMEYVELLGNHITVDEVAQRAGTIGYEILTSLGSRFEKIYK